ncbi:MAG: DNA-processing protein DprA [Pseudomonadota bacterium]
MDERSAWLRLWLAPGLGPAGAATLTEMAGSAVAALNLTSADFERAGISREARDYLTVEKTPDEVLRALEWAENDEHHLIHPGHPEYPAPLSELARPPVMLAVMGDVGLLADPQLAVVGSRSASRQGVETAQEFSRYLATRGLVMTSGLALGIDGACHRGALSVDGATIAVIATGTDRVYPARHRDLARQIVAQGGAIVSEFPLGAEPLPGHFPRRNRIISGLSLGVLVVEATLRSGSLITARYAHEQGREVFAIPGSIHQPTARGCHHLIKQGAKLVETADDILEELAPQLQASLLSPGQPRGNGGVPESGEECGLDDAGGDRGQLLEAMGFAPVSVDYLVANTPFKSSEIASMLLILELEGRVSSETGGRFQRLK